MARKQYLDAQRREQGMARRRRYVLGRTLSPVGATVGKSEVEPTMRLISDASEDGEADNTSADRVSDVR